MGAGLSAGAPRLRRWLADLQDELVTVDVAGQPRYVLREHAESLLAAEPTGAVHLLPGHDQWVMGPGTKETSVVPPGLRDVVTRKANLVTVGGVVRGTWAAQAGALTITWLDGQPPDAPQLDDAAARLADLLGRPLALVLRTGPDAGAKGQRPYAEARRGAVPEPSTTSRRPGPTTRPQP